MYMKFLYNSEIRTGVWGWLPGLGLALTPKVVGR